MCNEAALIAAREGCETVNIGHFERAIERVIGLLPLTSLHPPPALFGFLPLLKQLLKCVHEWQGE